MLPRPSRAVIASGASRLAKFLKGKLHLDEDAGVESVEAIIDPTAQVAEKRARHVILSENVAR